jgi:hypothetical protein
VARIGEIRNSYILVGKLEGKSELGRPRCRREDSIRPKVDLKEILFENAYWYSSG